MGRVEDTVALRQVFVGHYGFVLPIIMPPTFSHLPPGAGKSGPSEATAIRESRASSKS